MAHQRQPEHEHRPEHERREERVPVERERIETPLRPQPERWTTAGPIRTVGEDERVHDLELSAAATVADAAPLGLAAFAAATFTVGSVLAGWTPLSGLVGALPILLIFGGIAQFIAAMWAFRKGETFWATFLGVFGSWYAVLSLGILLGGGGALAAVAGPGGQSVSLGVSVAMFAFIALYLAYAAMGVSSVMVWVLGFLTASLALIAAAFFVGVANTPFLLMAAGYSGIVSALIAFYTSAAIVVNSALSREVLPY